MNVNFFRIIVIVLLYINGITAIGGGLILIIEPKGSILQLSVNLLNGSPFQNYLIPGIILFFFNGMLSLLTLFYTVKKKTFYPYMIIMQGMVLFTWLSTQIILLKYFFASLHITYFSISLILITFGIILLKKYSIKEIKI
ncbi:MAG: hypothetical protein ABI543_03075 [Ignavibacteria bacterium]